MPPRPPTPEPISTPGLDLLVIGLRFPAGIGERLRRSGHRIDDIIIDLALLLRLHPLIGIEAAVGTVAARHLHGDLAGEIGGLEA